MKKVLALLVAVLLLGCSGDDDKKGEIDVFGKWVQTYYRSSSTNSFIGQEDGTYFLFGSDGSFTFYYSGWGAAERTIKGTFKNEGGGTLRLNYDNETATVYIMDLDANGEATFLVDGLLYTGTYKFRKK